MEEREVNYVSKHKSPRRSISVFKSEELIFLEEGELDYTNRIEIHCKCGYRGSGEMEFIDVLLSDERWGSEKDKKKKREYIVNEKCPMCQKKSDLRLYKGARKARQMTDFTKLWEKGDKISFHICYTTYYYNKNVEKIGAKKDRCVLTFNVNTGFMYLIKDKSIVNWTYVNDKFAMEKKAEEFFGLIKEKETFRRFKKFLKLCVQKRGIKYYNFNKLIGNAKKAENFEVKDLRTIFMILKYPVLQDIEEKRVITNNTFPKKARVLLKKANNIDEAYRLIFGLKNKSAVKVFKKYKEHAVLSMFSNVLDGVDSYEYFVKIFDEKVKEGDVRLYELQEYNVSSYEGSIVNKYNTVHLSDFKKHHEEYDKNQLLFMGLKHIKQFYKNENTFIRKMFNSKKTVVRNYGDERVRQKIDMSFSDVLECIVDIYRMYVQVREYLPEVEIEYTNDIWYYHEMLSKTVSRIKIEDRIINYSQEEEGYYEEIMGGYRIGLAKTTNEIIESGTKMSICVPSYATAALNKILYIMFVYEKGEPVCCIEVKWDNKEMVVVQVKGKRNQKVEDELAIKLSHYFNKKKLKFDKCRDMMQYEGIETSGVFHGNKIKLPKVAEKDLSKKKIMMVEV